MTKDLGYNKFLFILPFDHRSSFEKGMFGVEEQGLTPEIIEKIKEEKQIIYAGFKKAVSEKIPKGLAAILVDEQFGDEILKNAIKESYVTLLTTEKSGQDEFVFEYGDQFGEHIKKYNPVFAKALVRYNPEDKQDLKNRQRASLKKLSDFCHSNDYKFLLEVLIEALENQLLRVNGNKKRYDKELRPHLAVEVVKELQEEAIEPDVWKMEGMETEEDYKALVNQARTNGRKGVGVVVLGRGAEKEEVEKWIVNGAKVEGVIGFAVGRTIFWNPLADFTNGKTTEDDAVDRISKNYEYYCDLFLRQKGIL
ncbi:MAG: hypothetical protein A2958_01780 [Candidatus Levybacteria bacterium RIFCSPLOWO2_01_FULL_38_13]|nr:MAG: hypothetical protein A2629_01290 [Candidatus Levybacteria bacterium RIFCSPHIGHO2_01_FULL_41_15]OGH34674.1 MAG: hypothetical protein A2958_01780 [Candidatus Levybacteria bacterium RIFCSPLOWO2_01_FULL_38_13]